MNNFRRDKSQDWPWIASPSRNLLPSTQIIANDATFNNSVRALFQAAQKIDNRIDPIKYILA